MSDQPQNIQQPGYPAAMNPSQQNGQHYPATQPVDDQELDSILGDDDGAPETEPAEDQGMAEPDYPSAGHSPRGGEFAWSDITAAAEFTRQFMELTSFQRQAFRYILDLDLDTPVVSILASLTPPGGIVASMNVADGLITTMSSKDMSFMEVIRVVTSISEMPVEHKRSLFGVVSRIASMWNVDPDAPDVRLVYRKNMSSEDMMSHLTSTIEQVDKDKAREGIDRINSLLSVWTER